MRINRNRSRSLFRQQSRWNGCLPWMMTMGLVMLIIVGGWYYLQDNLSQWLVPLGEAPTLADAQLAFNAGDLANSIDYAQIAYASDNNDHEALVLLVRALIYQSYADLNQDDDRLQALTLTSTAVERSPYNMQVLGIHALALQANGFASDAQRVALRVIRNDETSMTARLALSLSYADQGIFEAALRDALRAVEIATQVAPNWRADAYRVLALAHSDLGQYEDAASAVETGISYNRRLLALHFERALYAQQVGAMDTAIAYYFNVIAFDEDNIKARFRLCEASSLLGERDAAIDWCTQVTDFAPGWSESWYWLGREYYLNGDWRNTQITLNRCSTLQVAQSVPLEDRRFECWYVQGQAAEVLRDCPNLLALYAEYQAMSDRANLPQQWFYPDDMPTICITPIAPPDD